MQGHPTTVKQILPRIFYYLRTAKTTSGGLLIHVEFLMLS